MKPSYRLAAALVMGAVLGVVPTALYERHYQQALEEASKVLIREMCLSEIWEPVNTLTDLRRGSIDVLISSKEGDLSRGIYHLSLAVKGDLLSDTNIVRTLKTAARYRSKYPFRSGDAEQDEAVQELLGKVQ